MPTTRRQSRGGTAEVYKAPHIPGSKKPEHKQTEPQEQPEDKQVKDEAEHAEAKEPPAKRQKVELHEKVYKPGRAVIDIRSRNDCLI